MLVTAAAEKTMSDSGVPFEIIDLSMSKLYKGF